MTWGGMSLSSFLTVPTWLWRGITKSIDCLRFNFETVERTATEVYPLMSFRTCKQRRQQDGTLLV